MMAAAAASRGAEEPVTQCGRCGGVRPTAGPGSVSGLTDLEPEDHGPRVGVTGRRPPAVTATQAGNHDQSRWPPLPRGRGGTGRRQWQRPAPAAPPVRAAGLTSTTESLHLDSWYPRISSVDIRYRSTGLRYLIRYGIHISHAISHVYEIVC